MADSHSKNALETTGAKKDSNSFSPSGDSQLEQFVSFIKENWKPILSELVAVGVTTYLSHDAKTKASKTARN